MDFRKLKIVLIKFSVKGTFYGLLFLAWFAFPVMSQGQNKTGTTEIDAITYDQYLKQEWKELIKTSKEADRNGISFYYLDVRTGIAYYNLKKYRTAIKYLKKAYRSNQNNEYVNELLYYAYLFSGRANDAEKLKKDLHATLKKNMNIDTDPVFDAATFDFRFEINDDYTVTPADGEILTQSVRTGYKFFSFGVEQLTGRNQLYYNYGRVIKKNNVYYYDSTGTWPDGQAAEKQKIFQNQVYFDYGNQVADGLNVSAAFNWLNLVSIYETSAVKYTYNYIVGFLAVRKDFSNFKAGIFASVSNLERYFQFQPGAELTWYPFSNTNLYLHANVSYKMEQKDGKSYNELYFNPSIGVRLFTFYFEPSYTFGNISNYVEADALIINNDNDLIKNRLNILTYGYLFKGKLNIYLKYQHFDKVNSYYLNTTEESITYKNNAYTLGIKWRF